MKPTIALLLLIASVLIQGCRGNAPEAVSPLSEADAWSFSAAREDILSASCPQGAVEGFSQSFLLDVTPVDLGEADVVDAALEGLDFIGGWALSARMASFGGLSGLDVMPSGDLLAVSDGGALVEIGFDRAALRPTGQATLSFLRDAAGDIMSGKAEADSEGLHYTDEVALISFERDHRVMAFGYGLCGGNARAVPVSKFNRLTEMLGQTIRGNAGAEGLVVQDDRLLAGLETVIAGLGPVAVIDREGRPQFEAVAWMVGGGVPLVGLDRAQGSFYALHRAWNPLTGNAISITKRTPDGETKQLGKLQRPLAVDNFEGIAVVPGGDVTRLFIIADDNFSDRQRTLLFLFEVTA